MTTLRELHIKLAQSFPDRRLVALRQGLKITLQKGNPASSEQLSVHVSDAFGPDIPGNYITLPEGVRAYYADWIEQINEWTITEYGVDLTTILLVNWTAR